MHLIFRFASIAQELFGTVVMKFHPAEHLKFQNISVRLSSARAHFPKPTFAPQVGMTGSEESHAYLRRNTFKFFRSY